MAGVKRQNNSLNRGQNSYSPGRKKYTDSGVLYYAVRPISNSTRCSLQKLLFLCSVALHEVRRHAHSYHGKPKSPSTMLVVLVGDLALPSSIPQPLRLHHHFQPDMPTREYVPLYKFHRIKCSARPFFMSHHYRAGT